MVESYHERIDRICASWPTERKKVGGESVAYTRQSQRDAGDHSISHFKGTRKCGSIHFMKYEAWIFYTRWHPQLLPTADGKAPRPMKPSD